MTNLKIFLASWLLSLSLLQAIFVPFYASIKAMFQLRLNMTTHPLAPSAREGECLVWNIGGATLAALLVRDSRFMCDWNRTSDVIASGAKQSTVLGFHDVWLPRSLHSLAMTNGILSCWGEAETSLFTIAHRFQRPSHSAQRLCSSQRHNIDEALWSMA